MAHAGLILDNPVSGERFEFRRTSADTNGELLEFDLTLAADGSVPGAHVHPEQEERFVVHRGTVQFRLGMKKIVAGPGDTVVVPKGRVHAFKNVGGEEAKVRVQVTPALDMEQLFETTVASKRRSMSSAGVTCTRTLASSPPTFLNAWTLPAGTVTTSPASATIFLRPMRKAMVPSRTSKRSSCSGWM